MKDDLRIEGQPPDVIVKQLRADLRVAEAAVKQLSAVLDGLAVRYARDLVEERSAEGAAADQGVEFYQI